MLLPAGCGSRSEVRPNNYDRCKSDICGYDQSAASPNGIPKYCFKPINTPTPSACLAGCTCTTNATGVEKGLTYCGGKRTSCGYNENKQPLYCFEQVPSPTCVFDYQKNACTGTCANQQPCTRIVTKDDNGNEKVGCGCGGISLAGGTPVRVATSQPDIFETIGSFFRRLFGGK